MKKKGQTFWQGLKRFLEPIKEDKKMFFKSIFRTFLISLFGVFSTIFLQKIVFFIEKQDLSSMNLYILVYLILAIFIYIFSYFSKDWIFVDVAYDTIKILQRKWMAKFLKLDGSSVEKFGTGRLVAILDKGIKTRRELLILVFFIFIDAIIIVIFSFIMIYKSIGSKGIFVMILFILIHIFVGIINNKVVKIRAIRKNLHVEYQRSFVRVIMAKNEIIQSNKASQEINNLDRRTDSEKKIEKKLNSYQWFTYNIPEVFIVLLKISIIFLLGIQFFKGKIGYAEIVGIVAVFGLLEKSISRSVDFYKSMTNQFIDVQKIWDIFDNTPEIKGYNEGKYFVCKNGNILLNNVSFSYDKSPVFKDFSIEIQGGTKTAFVGESGGGKTTLIKLLAGYIRPDKGEVVVDGQKLSTIKLTDYYRHIGYLTQDPSVFDGTIHENLVYALDAEPDPKELEKVIKLAKCEFILEFEKGLETEIGERGVRLSGGQKQRLAIAKIMLKNPNIILLDEPTSALDSFNEEQISIALHNLFKGKTVIVVAHRLQTVKQADRICYIEGGKIVEEGTHHELVKLNGKYKKMLDLQSGF